MTGIEVELQKKLPVRKKDIREIFTVAVAFVMLF